MANDIASVERKLAQLLVAAHELEEQAPEHVAEGCAERMRETVAVDTGETKSTIQVASHGAESVLSAAGASRFLEGGTVYMRAQPFYRAAIAKAPEELAKIEPELAAILYAAVR